MLHAADNTLQNNEKNVGPIEKKTRGYNEYFGEGFPHRIAHALARITPARGGCAGRAKILALIGTNSNFYGLGKFLSWPALV